MANLIPPAAKKDLKIKYFIRVLTVWCVLVGLGLLVAAILKVPTYALLQTQKKIHAGAYDSAVETQIDFESAQTLIKEANLLSDLLADHPASESTINLTATLDQIAGEEITLQNFSYQLTDGRISSIKVSGIANTRLGLAEFSNKLESHSDFSEAKLPISNLAKDVDIAFNIDIIPTPK